MNAKGKGCIFPWPKAKTSIDFWAKEIAFNVSVFLQCNWQFVDSLSEAKELLRYESSDKSTNTNMAN